MKIYQKYQQAIVYHNLVKVNILIISILYFFACSRDCIPEKIYLPNNYIGRIYIVHNQPNGVKEKEGRFRIYHVPKSGFIFTQYYDDESCWVTKDGVHFLYELDKKETIKIPYELNYIMDSSFYKLNKNVVFGFNSASCSFGKYRVTSFVIDTLKNIKKYDTEIINITEQQIDSIKNESSFQ